MSEEDEDWGPCGHCASMLSMEQYNRTGTDEYCDDCPEICNDPRSIDFGEHADGCDGSCINA